MPEAQKISVLLGGKRLVAFKFGHDPAYPERMKFEYYHAISTQLQECIRESSISVPALAAEYADHRRHGSGKGTGSRVNSLIRQYLAGILNRTPPLTGTEQHIAQTAKTEVFLAYVPLSSAERDRIQMRVASLGVFACEIPKFPQSVIGYGGLLRKIVCQGKLQRRIDSRPRFIVLAHHGEDKSFEGENFRKKAHV